jgi:hypothetical protein
VGDEKDFAVGTESALRSSSKKESVDLSELNEYVNKVRKEVEISAKTGNAKNLEALINEPLFTNIFTDKRNFFQKIKDCAFLYINTLKNTKQLIKFRKYQVIESQIKYLSSKNKEVADYQKSYISIKNDASKKLVDLSYFHKATPIIGYDSNGIQSLENEVLRFPEKHLSNERSLIDLYFAGDVLAVEKSFPKRKFFISIRNYFKLARSFRVSKRNYFKPVRFVRVSRRNYSNFARFVHVSRRNYSNLVRSFRFSRRDYPKLKSAFVLLYGGLFGFTMCLYCAASLEKNKLDEIIKQKTELYYSNLEKTVNQYFKPISKDEN